MVCWYVVNLLLWTNLFYGYEPHLQQSRGCLGCCIKPPHIIAVDEPSKGLTAQGQRVNKASLTEDFWSTSTCEMDNSAVQSQRSVSSISASNQTVDPHSSAGSNPPEFVNSGKFILGLLLWNQTRQQWIGNKGSQKRTQAREPRLRWLFFTLCGLCISSFMIRKISILRDGDDSNEDEYVLGILRFSDNRSLVRLELFSGLYTVIWNATYESLLGTSKPFPQRIPLPRLPPPPHCAKVRTRCHVTALVYVANLLGSVFLSRGVCYVGEVTGHVVDDDDGQAQL
ncbi:hypothetical protein RJ639_001923 [Escallonia herrerae]|uniref:Gag1-like clamp domain-containing protein n=1 Tax=Escallonia herrerae TaxID=1293975 RepID=A0AA89BP08_9ASTE|nr:hypothetical protein RJ639_001923 [Escallonia herrerae]